MAKRFVLLAFVLFGCSSESTSNTTPVQSGECKANPTCASAPDPEKPPIACGPKDGCAPTCGDNEKPSTCPNNECMYVVKQSGDVINLRLARSRLWFPGALLSLTSIAVDPNLNPPCFANGAGAFNWLIRIDKKAGTLTTGGARKSEDGKTYSFLDETVSGADVGSVCPGFKGPDAPVDLRPVTSKIEIVDGKFTSPKAKKINVPIFDGKIPIILPLSESSMRDVTLSADGSCVGSWDRERRCDGDTLGWTTGGSIVSKITAEDADKVPVKSAGCQSLCALLVNDASKTENKLCKRGLDGKIPEIGDTCVGGEGCKNAFRMSATFAAYGITITNAPAPPPTTSTDAGSSD